MLSHIIFKYKCNSIQHSLIPNRQKLRKFILIRVHQVVHEFGKETNTCKNVIILLDQTNIMKRKIFVAQDDIRILPNAYNLLTKNFIMFLFPGYRKKIKFVIAQI
jgi:hypothetical protein